MIGLTAKVIRIGNSQGIRIPKAILEQCHLGTEVLLEPGENRLVVRRAESPRTGWEAAFRSMAQEGDDLLLDGDVERASQWDEEEWDWE